MKGTKLHASTNLLIFLFAITLGSFIAVNLGKDLDFDLANYHYYNAYAFLYHRWPYNYWPPTYIHVFLPPTGDILSYYLINSFSAYFAVLISGAIHGINLWLLFHIVINFISKKYYPTLTALIISILGIYGPLGFLGIGNFKNDHVVSIFILSFVWLQIHFWQIYRNENRIAYPFLIFACVLLGIGAEIKPQGNLYILAQLISILIIPIALCDRIKIFFATLFAGITGGLISAGYWMYIQWVQHANPFFPFLNNIFHSNEYPPQNFRYTEFTPTTFLQAITYPFYSVSHGTYAESFKDLRYSLIYIFFILFATLHVFKRLTRRRINNLPIDTTWLFLFYIFSYVICEFYFGVLRYILSIEMLSPLIILLLIREIFSTERAYIITATCYGLIALTIQPFVVGTREEWWHVKDYFDVKIPQDMKSVSKAMVLLPFPMYARSNDPRPQTYLIPFLPLNWHFIGIQFHQQRYVQPEYQVDQKIQHLIANFHGKFYVLTIEYALPELYRAVNRYGLAPTKHCEKIFSHRQAAHYGSVLLCEMIYIPNVSLTSRFCKI